VAKPKLECLDCNPPRQFKSLPGYNGHMQFKHDKTGVYIERPPSKTNEMIQQLLDQQGQLLNQQQALYELLADRSDTPIAVDEPIGVFSGGNGNGNLGNNNGNSGNNHQGNGSDNVDQGEDEPSYICEGNHNGGKCGSPIFPGQEHCPSCKGRLDWNGVAVN